VEGTVREVKRRVRVVFLEAKEEVFHEIYELHSGALAKYPKSHPPNLPSKVKTWAISRNYPTYIPTLNE